MSGRDCVSPVDCLGHSGYSDGRLVRASTRSPVSRPVSRNHITKGLDSPLMVLCSLSGAQTVCPGQGYQQPLVDGLSEPRR